MLAGDEVLWPYAVGWLLLAYPAAFYYAYRMGASDFLDRGEDVPLGHKIWSALFALVFAGLGVVIAAISMAFSSYVVIPLVIGLSSVFSSADKADFSFLGNLLLFGIPVAVGYVWIGMLYSEDHSTEVLSKRELTPKQTERALRRLRKQDDVNPF